MSQKTAILGNRGFNRRQLKDFLVCAQVEAIITWYDTTVAGRDQ
jgi:hypothetical protein